MKIYLDTVGCRLNQSEIESYARQFRAAGHTVLPTPGEADLVVINTCTVTNAAASDSRQKIRQAARSGAEEIVVTGCWSTLEPHSAASLPSVSKVIPNANKDTLVSDYLQVSAETFDLEPLAREPLPGARLRTRAFIKVQDGCDNRCTFCITTLARGAGRSRTLEDVLGDVKWALDGNTQEIVLTGVHLGSWGVDLSPNLHLQDLVAFILKNTNIPRLRLSSLEPWDLDADFFNLWEDPRLCRHLHLPLQSGCEETLRRMARKTTPKSYTRLVESARAVVPDIAITTDIIVGFPGESSEEFAKSLAFVKQMGFSGGHVFTYSARPGTIAANLPNQVPFAERKDRNAQIRTVLAESASAYQGNFLGKTLPVLWESASALGPDGWHLNGITDNYLRVNALAPTQLWNQITPVYLTGIDSNGFQGQLQYPA
jgi:threonylcarbamoyladenosine tRNA methylthiotransferase MtaB